MKIGIVTTTFENYGTRLQNLATVMLLKNQYKKAKIETIVISNGHFIFRFLSKIFGNCITSYIYLKLKFRGKINHNNNLLNYRAFFLKNDSLEQYKPLSKRYDLIVIGSDQIWKHYNYMTNFKFGLFCKNKICNAPSIPIRNISDEDYEFLFPLLSTFNRLNFREQSTVDYFNARGLKCECLADPTLRLPHKNWDILSKTPSKKYKYFIYILNDKKVFNKTIKDFEKEHDVVKIFLYNKGNDKFYYSPLQFLSILRNSECVITNSFHGACFAKIFNKKLKIIKTNDDSPLDCRFDIFCSYGNLIK